MKRLFSLAVSLLIAALFSFTAVMAQAPATAPSPQGTVKKEPAQLVPDKPGVQYKQVRVIKGGNLALIAERCGHTQVGWRPLYAANQDSLPKAEKVGEMWRVLIRPGQILNLPTGWSYQTLNPEYVEPFPPVPPPAPKKTSAVSPLPSVGGGSLWLVDPAFWALILLILAALAVLAAIAVPWWFRRYDPRRYPAVVPGGLADDPLTAVGQAEAAYPGLTTQADEAQVGYFEKVNRSDPDQILVGMTIQGGAEVPIHVRIGDQVFRLVRNGRVIWHALMRCGNALRFKPPVGWRFVVGQATNIPRPTAAVSVATASATTSASAPGPTPPVPPTPPISSIPPVPPVPPAPVFPAEPVSDEVEVIVDGFLIKVVGKNGNIPAIKIRTGDGTEVVLQRP